MLAPLSLQLDGSDLALLLADGALGMPPATAGLAALALFRGLLSFRPLADAGLDPRLDFVGKMPELQLLDENRAGAG